MFEVYIFIIKSHPHTHIWGKSFQNIYKAFLKEKIKKISVIVFKMLLDIVWRLYIINHARHIKC